MFIQPEMGQRLARTRQEEAESRMSLVAATREAALARPQAAASARAEADQTASLPPRRRWRARRAILRANAAGPTSH